jgi:lipid A ethanolaminephosphotransferase
MMQTDIHESLDLLTLKQAISFIFLGILPALIVYKSKIKYQPLKAELLLRLKVVVITIILILVSFFSFSQKYISFVREHKPLRFSVNPTYWVYSIGKYININIQNGEIIVAPLGRDAKVVKSDVNSSAKLIIMVVGEATRADHFSLNGYEKETNPLLQQEDIINFSNLYSCGTSTAASVPCMFSVYPRSEFSYKKGLNTENVLDVLNHTQAIEILWRDNNSDSKGVALRVPYFDYKGSQYNTIIEEGESRDIGLLVGLDEYVSNHKNQDILIVLHQMGNHGPAYYKRYTKEFEMFTPTCKTNLLEDCTKEEISNTYDNAVIYTDNFLVQAINFLKEHDKTHTTALIYMSDHGESLGENGIYLHGLPYFMAPDAQIHVAALMWFGEKMKESINTKVLKKKSSHNYSHDNLFHTLLGIFEVQTKVYDKKLDILNTK